MLQSRLFVAWTTTVAGRLKSDLRLSPGTVYNPFPFPAPDPELDATAAAILAARGDGRLDRLYAPGSMPPSLAQAHEANDVAVDRCFAGRRLGSRSERLQAVFAACERGTG